MQNCTITWAIVIDLEIDTLSHSMRQKTKFKKNKLHLRKKFVGAKRNLNYFLHKVVFSFFFAISNYKDPFLTIQNKFVSFIKI